jgi:hypothetical protein
MFRPTQGGWLYGAFALARRQFPTIQVKVRGRLIRSPAFSSVESADSGEAPDPLTR